MGMTDDSTESVMKNQKTPAETSVRCASLLFLDITKRQTAATRSESRNRKEARTPGARMEL